MLSTVKDIKYEKNTITRDKLIIFILLVIAPDLFKEFTAKDTPKLYNYMFITFLFGLSICLSLSKKYNFLFKQNKGEINLGKVILVYYLFILILINYVNKNSINNKEYNRMIKLILILPILIAYIIKVNNKIYYLLYNLIIFILHFIIYYYMSNNKNNNLLLLAIIFIFIILLIKPIIDVVINKNIANTDKSSNYNYLNRNLVNSNVNNVFNNLLNYTVINILLFIIFTQIF